MSDYDALTDLFLSEGGPAVKPRAGTTLRLSTDMSTATTSDPATHPAPSPPQEVLAPPAPAREATLEGLILGHLPVLGSAWVTQYAKHAAELLHEAVAILRWQGGQAWVDIVTPRSAPSTPHSRVGAMGSDDENLEKAIAAAARRARHWLLRVDDISEPDLLAIAGLSSVTLLTGADDAAVVASYQSMKGLCQIASVRESASGTPLTIGLAIMGAEDEKASAAEAKLRRAGVTFLGREIGPAARVAKIGACTTTAVFRGDATIPLQKAVELIMGQGGSSAVAPTPLIGARPVQADASVIRSAPPLVEAKPSPVASAAPATFSRTVPAAPASQQHAEAATRTAAPRGSALPLPTGLRMIAATCPYAPLLRLATDAEGTLHLIAHVGSDAVRDLLTAASWSVEHAALLAAAYTSLDGERLQSGPTLHLLTDDARTVRGLLDTAVRVHLVVTTDGGAVLKPLN